MDKNWISTNELAKIKGISSRAIRKSFSNSNYCVRKNGRSYEVLISTLEDNIQEKIQKSENFSEMVNAIKENDKKLALAEFELVRKWREYRIQNPQKCKSTENFIELFNKGLIYSNLYKITGSISKTTLYRWDKNLRENNDNWTILVKNYSNSSKTTTLTDYEKELFLSILLSPNKLNIGKAIKLTKYSMEQKGIISTSSDMKFRRFANKYQKEHYDIWVLAREGEKALKDKVLPYIERDLSKLDVGDVIIGDGHRLAIKAINPFTGKICRPMLLAYQDWKSGALIGFEIMLEENTQCITSALRNAIINLGKVPKFIYQDNRKAFKSNYFTDDNNISGLFARLGIQPIFAKPYNAKAKSIERFFREMQDSFERLLPSFVGANIDNQPAYMKRNEKFHKNLHKEYIPTINELTELVKKWLEFHYSQPCPNVENKTIREVLISGKGSGVDILKLDDLMMAAEVKSIGRNGIRFLKSDYYDESLYGLKIKVVIKYSFFDLSQIKVYDTNGKFICNANRLEPINPLANYIGNAKDVEDFKQRVKQQKELEKQTVNAYISQLKRNNVYLPIDNEYIENDICIKTSAEIPKLDDLNNISEIEGFSSRYERYEFLKNKSELTDNEENWLKDYKNSDEYKLIYE